MGRFIKIELSDDFKIRDSLDMKSFRISIKKFIIHSIIGWFPSLRSDLSPNGVQKVRIIDRENNIYQETILDADTGRVIHDVKEKLTDHRG